MENVKFETQQSYKLTQDEMRAMYVRMALCRFRHIYEPVCNPDNLLEKLIADFKELVREMQEVVEQNPNNYTLRRANAFFVGHYSNLVKLKKRTE